jgi:cell division protein FtsA
MAGVSISSAFVTVNGSHIENLNSHGVVAVPPNSTEVSPTDVARVTEAAQAVSLPSTREIIHVIPRDFTVNSQDGIKDPIGMSGVRLEVETNIIHGSTTAISNIERCISQVGVDVEQLVYTGIASAEAVLTDTEKELGTLLLDIGGGTTSIIAYLDGSPIHSAVLPLGGRLVTNDLALGLAAKLEDAEKIKLKLSAESRAISDIIELQSGKKNDEFDLSEFSLDDKTVPRSILYRIIDARLEEIFNLVSLELAKAKLQGKLPAGVVLTGGSAQTAGAEKVAKKIFRGQIRIGTPKGITGLIDEIQGPGSAAGVGAILFGVNQSRSGNLLSMEDNRGKMNLNFGQLLNKLKSFLP